MFGTLPGIRQVLHQGKELLSEKVERVSALTGPCWNPDSNPCDFKLFTVFESVSSS